MNRFFNFVFMLKSLIFFIRYLFFWILFFAINRIIFQIWNFRKFDDTTFSEILKTYLFGLHMDISMASYFCIIPFIIFLVAWLAKIRINKKLILYYTCTLNFITVLITCIDFNIYTEWGTKINGRAIDFLLSSPSEALASTASSPVFSILLIALILNVIGFYLAKKIILEPKEYIDSTNIWIKIPVALLILGFTFLGIRGGWGISPMNPSKVYFSSKPILNHAALNTNWLLLSNYFKKSDTKNHYVYFSKEEDQNLVNKLYPKTKGEQIEILNTQKPNIVLFILESFTADVVKELGGEESTTPAFSKLIADGLLFKNIYSSGDRTDKGLVAILSAFPSQAVNSIIKENDKQEKLPSIMNQLADVNYNTSFFYGGDTDFSNFKSYLLTHKIQTLVDSKNLESKDLTSKWGAYDEVIFDKHIKFLATEKQPFFSTLLTLSNHEPFELPKPGIFENNSVENKFRNTSYYTAECLLSFINKAKTQSWYKNTIFIFIADHGHRLPKSTNEIYVDRRYHIPLLISGGALKEEFRGATIDKYGGQTDLASTLLNQLNISDKPFKYSNNLLDSNSPGFGFYCWDNGFGIVDKNKVVSYDPISQKIIYSYPENINSLEKEKALTDAKALMQSIYQDYLDY